MKITVKVIGRLAGSTQVSLLTGRNRNSTKTGIHTETHKIPRPQRSALPTIQWSSTFVVNTRIDLLVRLWPLNGSQGTTQTLPSTYVGWQGASTSKTSSYTFISLQALQCWVRNRVRSRICNFSLGVNVAIHIDTYYLFISLITMPRNLSLVILK